MHTEPPAPDPVPIESLLAHRGWVRALARRLVADENAADDLEQQAWAAAIERPPRSEGSSRAWLGTVVRNFARRAHRSGATRKKHEARVAPVESRRSPAEIVAEAETHRRLVDAVCALDDPYRTAVVLRYFEGMTVRELAERTGVPFQTAKTRLRRGLAQLRSRFGETKDRRLQALAPILLPASIEVGPAAVPAASEGGRTQVAGVETLLIAVAAVVVAVGLFWMHGAGDPVAATSELAATSEPSAPDEETVDAATSEAEHAVHEEPTEVGGASPPADAGTSPESEGTTFRGRVVLPPGVSAGDVFVRAKSDHSNATKVPRRLGVGFGGSWEEAIPVPVAEDGTFSVSHEWPNRMVTFRADLPGHAPITSEPVSVSKHVPSLVLDFTPVKDVEGRVVSAAGGRPIAGARIRLFFVDTAFPMDPVHQYSSRDAPVVATSDADGAFRIRGVEGLIYMVRVEAEGFLPALFSTLRFRQGKVRLDPALRISGMLRDADGSAVPGATITVLTYDKEGRLHVPVGTTTSDESGSFTLTVNGNGRRGLRVTSGADGRPNLLRSEHALDGSADPLELTVRTAAPISGIAVDGSGKEVVGVAVRAHRVTASGTARNAASSTRTDASGRFLLPGLASGTYVVASPGHSGRLERYARAPTVKGARGWLPLRREGVDAGTSDVRLTFERGRSIEGAVDLPDGVEAADLRVTARSADRRFDAEMSLHELSFPLTDEGGFEIDGLAAGSYHLVVLDAFRSESEWQPVSRASVGAGRAGLRVRLERTGLIRGQLILGKGKSLALAPGVRIVITPLGGGAAREVFTNGSGNFTAAGLVAEAAYRIEAFRGTSKCGELERVVPQPGFVKIVDQSHR